MQRFHIPAVLREAIRQPIEQLGMCRRPSLAAEVLRRGHQAASEVHAPDAVDDHARRKRVLRRREPAGKAEPVARLIRGEWRQARRRVSRDDIPTANMTTAPKPPTSRTTARSRKGMLAPRLPRLVPTAPTLSTRTAVLPVRCSTALKVSM